MKDSRYFPHDSNARNDERLINLRRKYGWEGYGIYFAIIELLRDSTKFSMALDLDTISYILNTESIKIQHIIDDFGLFRKQNSKFWSPSLNKRMKRLEDLRLKKQKAARERWSKNDGEKSIYKKFEG